jgi:hypothetical protein
MVRLRLTWQRIMSVVIFGTQVVPGGGRASGTQAIGEATAVLQRGQPT